MVLQCELDFLQEIIIQPLHLEDGHVIGNPFTKKLLIGVEDIRYFPESFRISVLMVIDAGHLGKTGLRPVDILTDRVALFIDLNT